MKCLVNNSVSLPTNDVYSGLSLDMFDFGVDWLNVRLKCNSVDELILRLIKYIPDLEVADFERRPSGGVCFYKNAYYIPKLGYSSFVISFNVDALGNVISYVDAAEFGQLHGIQISISGVGCRWLRDFFNNFLDAIEIYSPVCSRIDVACDIYDSENMIVPLIQSFSEFAYNRENADVDFKCGLKRSPGWVDVDLVYDDIVDGFTRNVTIGGRSSTKGTLQLYNKRAEVLQRNSLTDEVKEATLNSVPNSGEYWWRLEYRCKSNAQKVFLNLLQSRNIYSAFYQACEDFGTFVHPVYGSKNIDKALDVVEWLVFLDFVRRASDNNIHLVELVAHEYIPASLTRNEKYVSNQIGGAVVCCLIRAGLDLDFRKRIFSKIFPAFLSNPRYKPVIDELISTYGLKLEEFNDLVYSQVGFDF